MLQGMPRIEVYIYTYFSISYVPWPRQYVVFLGITYFLRVDIEYTYTYLNLLIESNKCMITLISSESWFVIWFRDSAIWMKIKRPRDQAKWIETNKKGQLWLAEGFILLQALSFIFHNCCYTRYICISNVTGSYDIVLVKTLIRLRIWLDIYWKYLFVILF